MYKPPNNWEFKLAGAIIAYFVLTSLLNSSSATMSHLNQYLTVHHQVSDFSINELDYSNFAYILYATSLTHLNLAVISLSKLKLANTKVPNLVVVYTPEIKNETPEKFQRLHKLADEYGISFRQVPRIGYKNADSTWQYSFTQFQVFNQVEFSKVVYFDSDSMLTNFEAWSNEPQTMDELFSLDCDIALPQAYWLSKNQGTHWSQRVKYLGNEKGKRRRTAKLLLPEHKYDNRDNFFASHVIVFKPDKTLYRDLLKLVYNPWWWQIFRRQKLHKTGEFNMDILNKYLDEQIQNGRKNVGVLPHKVYGVLSGEFNEKKHARFVAEAEELPFINAESNEGWNAMEAIERAKLVHFSDAPIPKPWEGKIDNEAYYNVERAFCSAELDQIEEKFPYFKPWVTDDCDSVKVWEWLREEFERYKGDMWVD